MYYVSKDKGYNKNVILTNKDTGASAELGVLTPVIVKLLSKEITFDTSVEETGMLKLTDEWKNIIVSEELAHDLQTSMSPIKTPKRNQSKKSEQHEIHKSMTQSGKQAVDIFDLIFNS